MYRDPSPSLYAPGAPSPSSLPLASGPPSPIPSTQVLQPPATPSGQIIQPGARTYTTSTSLDGRTTYHPFKAVPVNYRTSNGIVSVMQWVPAEATGVLSIGTELANVIDDQDFVSSSNRNREAWQKDEEHRIRKEEKEATKRRKKEKERPAREREARAAPYNSYEDDLERGMDGVDLGRGRSASQGEYNRSPYHHPIAPPPPNMGGAGNLGYPPAAPVGYPSTIYPPSGQGPDGYRDPSPYRGVRGGAPDPAILSRSRDPSPNSMGAPSAGIYGQRAPSPRPGAMPQYGGNRSRDPSPIPVTVTGPTPGPPALRLRRSRDPLPIPGSIPGPNPPAPPRSRAASLLPGALPPSHGQPAHQGGGAPLGGPEQPQMLSLPDGFSRPANLSQSYTFFDTLKIKDMNDLEKDMPRMPQVLGPHDVHYEDWNRFIRDLTLAWTGKLPSANRSSQPFAVTAELIDLWNNSFFAQRGLKVVLFKSHKRHSGPRVGQVDHNLPGFSGDSDSDSDLDSDSSDLLSSYALCIKCIPPRDGALGNLY